MEVRNLLEELKYVCLEEYSKQNQILSQKGNDKRSVCANQNRTPFSQFQLSLKSKKKLTFEIEEQESTDKTQDPTKN